MRDAYYTCACSLILPPPAPPPPTPCHSSQCTLLPLSHPHLQSFLTFSMTTSWASCWTSLCRCGWLGAPSSVCVCVSPAKLCCHYDGMSTVWRGCVGQPDCAALGMACSLSLSVSHALTHIHAHLPLPSPPLCRTRGPTRATARAMCPAPRWAWLWTSCASWCRTTPSAASTGRCATNWCRRCG